MQGMEDLQAAYTFRYSPINLPLKPAAPVPPPARSAFRPDDATLKHQANVWAYNRRVGELTDQYLEEPVLIYRLYGPAWPGHPKSIIPQEGLTSSTADVPNVFIPTTSFAQNKALREESYAHSRETHKVGKNTESEKATKSKISNEVASLSGIQSSSIACQNMPSQSVG